jgi:integrase
VLLYRPEGATRYIDMGHRFLCCSSNSGFLDCFRTIRNPSGHIGDLRTTWEKSLRRAEVPYFRIYDLRSTYAAKLSAGGVADEWVTQMLCQSDAQVFKKYSQMKLQMKREGLDNLNRRANEMAVANADALMTAPLCTAAVQ